MTRVSTGVFAAALVIGGAAISPAAAKDKPAAAAPAITLSAPVRTAIDAAQKALAANDLATATTQVNAAAGAAKTDDDRYVVAITRFNVELTKQKTSPQTASQADFTAALTGLIDNPRTKPTDVANYLMVRGRLEYQAQQYGPAIQDLSRARSMGVNDPDLTLQLVEAKTKTHDVAGGLADLKSAVDAEVAAGRKPPEAWYTFGLNQARTAKLQPQLSEWLALWVAAYPTPGHWHDAIVLSGLEDQPSTVAEKQHAIDLFRLMRASKALQDTSDYRAYITWAIDSGSPAEAKSVLTEASALGKLPTTKIENAGTMKRANLAIAANGPIAALKAKAPSSANGNLALTAGDALYGAADYTGAAEMYKLAAQKGGVDANLANLRAGEAAAMAGDKAGASASFVAVAQGSPSAPAARIWNAWANRSAA